MLAVIAHKTRAAPLTQDRRPWARQIAGLFFQCPRGWRARPAPAPQEPPGLRPSLAASLKRRPRGKTGRKAKRGAQAGDRFGAGARMLEAQRRPKPTFQTA